MPCRWPTLLFLIALAALAIQPRILLDARGVYYKSGLQHALIGLALIASALAYGVRRTVELAAPGAARRPRAEPRVRRSAPGLTPGLMLISLLILGLPWSFTQVVMAPEARRAGALVIALAPLLSLAAAGILQAAGLLQAASLPPSGRGRRCGHVRHARLCRLRGGAARGDRPGRSWPGSLAVLNLAFVILSGTRMAIVASLPVRGDIGLASSELRRWLRTRPVAVAIARLDPGWRRRSGICRHLKFRMMSGGSLRWSERDVLWPFYFQEFLRSPLFGRGLGAGFVATALPHNEYLHLLVIGGGVGFVLCMPESCSGFASCFAGRWRRADRALLIATDPGSGRLLADRQSPDLFDRARALRLSWPAAAARSSRAPDCPARCNDGPAPRRCLNRSGPVRLPDSGACSTQVAPPSGPASHLTERHDPALRQHPRRRGSPAASRTCCWPASPSDGGLIVPGALAALGRGRNRGACAACATRRRRCACCGPSRRLPSPTPSFARCARRAYAGFAHAGDAHRWCSSAPTTGCSSCSTGRPWRSRTSRCSCSAALFDDVLARRGQRVTIVGATSGDTGSAAIEAFAGSAQVRIVMLHPEGRVSAVQRRQMTTVAAPTTSTTSRSRAPSTTARTCVKAMFADAAFRERSAAPAVNSINWARIVAQAVYYVAAGAARWARPTGRSPSPCRPAISATSTPARSPSAWACRSTG